MTTRTIAFFGGNGHCAARLYAARAVPDSGLSIADIPYPGFEGRPPAADRETFFRQASESVSALQQPAGFELIYATGIGSLIALELLADGKLPEVPIVLQGPVLWGLEHRLMPRVMRLSPVRSVAAWLFRTRVFRARFRQRYFVCPVSATFAAEFFQGYGDCAAFSQFFAWFTPSHLRRLARQFSARPDLLDSVTIWRGERDRVVGLDEIHWTEQALSHRFPIKTFSDWGHYPMIDDPQAWINAIARAVSQ